MVKILLDEPEVPATKCAATNTWHGRGMDTSKESLELDKQNVRDAFTALGRVPVRLMCEEDAYLVDATVKEGQIVTNTNNDEQVITNLSDAVATTMEEAVDLWYGLYGHWAYED